MRFRFSTVILRVLPLLVFFGCTKNNPLVTDAPADYYPMHVGNQIVYRMDSLKYVNFGTETLSSYLAKEIVEDSLTDNVGRPSFRIVRYLNDTNGLGEWIPSTAYLVTVTKTVAEVVDNNLRFIKLVTPVQDGVSWLGNAYIDTKSEFTEVPYLDDWHYTYSNTGLPFDVMEGTIPVTVTVDEADDVSGLGDGSYTQTIYSQEIYGKGIGPIYKKFLYSVYQAPNVEFPSGITYGYGLTFNMVSHNF